MNIPRDFEKGRRNPAITTLTENLCLAMFDRDEIGERRHLIDISKTLLPHISRAYDEIKTVKQAKAYVFWAMLAICWNNRAKLVEQDNFGGWYEAPATPSDALNESLPEGSAWQARVPAKMDSGKSAEAKRDARAELAKAEWSVDYFTKYEKLGDQEIYDTLTELYGFTAGAVKVALETRNDDGRYAFARA